MKALTALFKPIIDLFSPIFNWLKEASNRSFEATKQAGMKLKPPKLYSWQSVLILSVVLGITSLIAGGLLEIVAALFGQIFLLVALYWFCVEASIAITSWIVAAFISAFLYLNLRSLEAVSHEIANLAIVAFPI
ncbi:MAG: DUF5357 family protein, partial [Cyanobacteriota bacterium]|nr:DUF5357 family protein [Cyanobacteriota bacterium]